MINSDTIFTKSKRIIDCFHLVATDGSYSLGGSSWHFEHCRERFGPRWWPSTPGFYFAHPTGKARSVAAFILRTEEILKRRKRSDFAETTRQEIVWVEPLPFWKASRMRRSLFTILLRAGMYYSPEKDNYEQALEQEKWANQTERAIMRFLFGFTKYVGPSIAHQSTLESIGWVQIFTGKNDDCIKSYLVWPAKDRYQPANPIPNALWF